MEHQETFKPTPKVDWWPVVAFAQQQLWRSVPQGYHSIGVSVRLTILDAKGSGQAKVCQLESSLLRDEDVGCLHISMDDLVGVNVIQT